MEIQEILSTEHSVDTAKHAASVAESSEEDFGMLVAILGGKDKELARRAAWAFGKAGEKRPHWLNQHLDVLTDLLVGESHPAIPRNIYRVLQFADIPEGYHARVFDLCLRELRDPRIPAAIKVFAMTVAANIADCQPALKSELKLSIQDNLAYGSAGFRNRAGKILRRL